MSCCKCKVRKNKRHGVFTPCQSGIYTVRNPCHGKIDLSTSGIFDRFTPNEIDLLLVDHNINKKQEKKCFNYLPL